jgi:hypothetical protein
VELRNLPSVQRQLGASRLLALAPARALVVSSCAGAPPEITTSVATPATCTANPEAISNDWQRRSWA